MTGWLAARVPVNVDVWLRSATTKVRCVHGSSLMVNNHSLWGSWGTSIRCLVVPGRAACLGHCWSVFLVHSRGQSLVNSSIHFLW